MVVLFLIVSLLALAGDLKWKRYLLSSYFAPQLQLLSSVYF